MNKWHQYLMNLLIKEATLAVLNRVFPRLSGPLHHGYPLGAEPPPRHALENVTPPWDGKAEVSDCKGGDAHRAHLWLLWFMMTSSSVKIN